MNYKTAGANAGECLRDLEQGRLSSFLQKNKAYGEKMDQKKKHRQIKNKERSRFLDHEGLVVTKRHICQCESMLSLCFNGN